MANLVSELQDILEERRSSRHVIGDYSSREEIHWQRDHKERIREVDQRRRGEWLLTFPDGSQRIERPKVPNYYQLAMDARVSSAARSPFTVRCDARPGKEDRAKKRERIGINYLDVNNYRGLQRYWYNDLDVCGVSYKLVLPDLPNGRFPCIRRLDPRQTWPDAPFAPDRKTANLIYASEIPLRLLWSMFQDRQDEIMAAVAESKRNREAVSQNVMLMEWYDSSEILIVADLTRKKGSTGIELLRASNKLGKLPIVASVRTTSDGIPQGVFDQLGPVLENENRIINLLVDAAQDWISSPPVWWNIANPEDWGKGVGLEALGPDGFMRRMPPDQANSQIFPVLDRLRGAAREQAVFPESVSGDFPVQYASGAGVSASQGSYSSSIAYHQDLESEACMHVLELCYETDELYHNERKEISGMQDGASFHERYTPSEDIGGDYANRVQYPLAGQDPLSVEIRLTQQGGNRWIAKRTAREHLSTVKDVLKEEEQILREDLLDTAMLFIKAQAQQGNAAPLVAMNNALNDPKTEDVLAILPQIPVILTGDAAAPGREAPTDAFTDMASIARGGVPSPTTNVPGVGAGPSAARGITQSVTGTRGGAPLPPLDSILVRG